MRIQCSVCRSYRIVAREVGKKAGSLIGLVGGAAGDAVSTLGCRSRQFRRCGFRRSNRRVAPAFPLVIFLSLCPQDVNEQPITHLWVQACQYLWLVKYYEVYQQLHLSWSYYSA
jgi:hypothetical protein